MSDPATPAGRRRRAAPALRRRGRLTRCSGYHGRYLRVDPRPGRTGLRPARRVGPARLPRRRRAWGPGSSPTRRPPGLDPLGPDAALVFALSPLVGSPLTTSAKFAVVAISPLTGRLCDALSSSHFAIAAKRAGVDALAITGGLRRAVGRLRRRRRGRDEPAVDVPAGGRPLGPLRARGRGPHPRRARAGLAGRGDRPGGRAADPVRDDQPRRPPRGPGRARGRARARSGSRRSPSGATAATPAGRPGRDGRARPATSPPARSARRPRSTASWGRSPTCSSSTASTRCRPATSRRATSRGPSGWRPRTSAPRRRIARNSCAACTIGCEHIYAGSAAAGRGVRLEYESLFALGPLCGVDDPGAVLRAARGLRRRAGSTRSRPAGRSPS